MSPATPAPFELPPTVVSEYSLTMVAEPSRGRDRLLAEAMKMFAAKGYAATSVADIQRASGLAPGSGALYKHFGSKRELLEAAVAHRIDSIVAAREQYDAGDPDSVEQAVRTAGQLIWSNLKQSEDLLKVMLREPEELGDLDEKTWQVITDNAYQRFADELAASNRSGRTQHTRSRGGRGRGNRVVVLRRDAAGADRPAARQHRGRPLLRGLGESDAQRPRAIPNIR